MTQLDSRLVRQLCTMSGRTATWKQPVHSTFVLTVNDQVGRLPSDQDSPMRARTGYKSLKCGEAPFSSVREEIVPEDCVDTFLPTPVPPHSSFNSQAPIRSDTRHLGIASTPPRTVTAG